MHDTGFGRRPRNLGLTIGLALMAVLVLIAIIAPIFLTTAADTMGPRGEAPSSTHWLGTDAAGHDLLARSLVATRLTLVMALFATALSVVIGTIAGAGAWMLPGRAREAALRIIEAAVAFPALLLALVVAAIMGPGTVSVVFAIGIAGIPYFARLTANLAAQISNREFVGTARRLGVGRMQTLGRHVLPNMAEPLLVLAASTFAQSIASISALSFVGLGVQSPEYDYGKLLNEALPSLLAGRPYEIVGPTVMIVACGIAGMLIGDGLAAVANPRQGTRPGTQRRVGETSLSAGARPLLAVENLVIADGNGRHLVRGVSFAVGVGEILGVVGESGSGKSLTAMAVARLLPDGVDASARRLQLDEIDLLDRVPRATMARTIGLVYQDPGTSFNPARRMGPQLTTVLREHLGQSRSGARARILEALRSVQLSDPTRRLRQHPHELSGGMRQRAMIASTLVQQPKLLIADEPTTALDVTVQAEILRELRRMNERDGTAMLFISHDIGVVKALCHRVIVMKDGEIVETIASGDLDADHAQHPYTRTLLAATPTIVDPTAETDEKEWAR